MLLWKLNGEPFHLVEQQGVHLANGGFKRLTRCGQAVNLGDCQRENWFAVVDVGLLLNLPVLANLSEETLRGSH